MRIKERDPDTGEIKADLIDLPIEVTLEVAKQRKYAELRDAEAAALATFTSPALGSPHTYLSGMSDMLLLAGEYAFVKGSDYDSQPIIWFTMEAGNVPHTAAQFITVYLDGRANVQTVKYHRAALEAQVSPCTTIDAVNAITW